MKFYQVKHKYHFKLIEQFNSVTKPWINGASTAPYFYFVERCILYYVGAEAKYIPPFLKIHKTKYDLGNQRSHLRYKGALVDIEYI